MDSLSLYKESKKKGVKFVESNIGLYETVMLKVHMDLVILMVFDLKFEPLIQLQFEFEID